MQYSLSIAICALPFFLRPGYTFAPKATAKAKSYKGFGLFEVVPRNESQVQYLQDLLEHDLSNKYDFWTPPSHPNSVVDVMVDAEAVKTFQEDLTSRSLQWIITEPDIQRLVDEERESMRFSTSVMFDDRSRRKNGLNFRLDMFHSYPEMVGYLRRIARLYSGIAELIKGPFITHERRTIYGIRIGNRRRRSRNRPAVWIDGGAHAREWIAPAAALVMINKLVTEYRTNRSIAYYVDNIDFYIVPVLNPDGYDHSGYRERLWRKNRNMNNIFDDARDYCRGVDLNRNFDWHWGGKGSVGNPCQISYRGTGAFSEPESKSLRLLLRRIGKGRLKAYISLHAYAQLWAYPFGHERNAASSDSVELANVARQAIRRLASQYGTVYYVGTSANFLYPAAGAATDWVKGYLGVKYVYLIELRPQYRDRKHGFFVPTRMIIPTGEETFAGLTAIFDRIIA